LNNENEQNFDPNIPPPPPPPSIDPMDKIEENNSDSLEDQLSKKKDKLNYHFFLQKQLQLICSISIPPKKRIL